MPTLTPCPPPRLRGAHAEWLRLGKADAERRAAYRALFKAHMEPKLLEEIRSATNGGYVLGSERFQQEIATMLRRRVARGSAGRPRRESVAEEQMHLL